MRGSHGLSARRARRTKSRGSKGLQLEVGAQRAPRLLVLDNWNRFLAKISFKKIIEIDIWPKALSRILFDNHLAKLSLKKYIWRRYLGRALMREIIEVNIWPKALAWYWFRLSLSKEQRLFWERILKQIFGRKLFPVLRKADTKLAERFPLLHQYQFPNTQCKWKYKYENMKIQIQIGIQKEYKWKYKYEN